MHNATDEAEVNTGKGVEVDDEAWRMSLEVDSKDPEPDVLEEATTAMLSADRFVVNAAAFEAGLEWVRCKLLAADKESRRKEFQLEIQKEYQERESMAATPAEKAARGDARYVQFLADLAIQSERRDRAEVLYHCLRDRVYLLPSARDVAQTAGPFVVTVSAGGAR